MYINSIGYTIKMLRFERNCSQKEIGDAIGLHPSAISQIETNKRKHKREVIAKLADLFDVKIEEIIGDNEVN